MSVIICPPDPEHELGPDALVPTPGFGATVLRRNGVTVWCDFWGDWWNDEEPAWTMGMLTEWCPVRQGLGWSLEIRGPMSNEVYRLRRGRWMLTERGLGFA